MPDAPSWRPSVACATIPRVIVDCAVYEGGSRREIDLKNAYEAGQRHGAFAWIGLYEPTEQEFDSVRREFGLHELAVEDAIKAHQRPKLEVYGDTLFLVLKTVRYLGNDEIDVGEILVFAGQDFMVTVRHGEPTPLDDVRRRLEHEGDLLRLGATAPLHAIVDSVVDDYMPVVELLQEDIDQVEAEVFAPDRMSSAERIYKLQREVLEFSRAAAPLADPLERLARGDLELVHETVRPYLRDVQDHLLRVVEQLHGFRDILTSALQANLAQVSVRQNDDVRKISAWAAIIAVPTMIAGIYGMNFRYMPELDWRLGYPAVIVLIVLACVALWLRLRRAGWL